MIEWDKLKAMPEARKTSGVRWDELKAMPDVSAIEWDEIKRLREKPVYAAAIRRANERLSRADSNNSEADWSAPYRLRMTTDNADFGEAEEYIQSRKRKTAETLEPIKAAAQPGSASYQKPSGKGGGGKAGSGGGEHELKALYEQMQFDYISGDGEAYAKSKAAYDDYKRTIYPSSGLLSTAGDTLSAIGVGLKESALANAYGVMALTDDAVSNLALGIADLAKYPYARLTGGAYEPKGGTYRSGWHKDAVEFAEEAAKKNAEISSGHTEGERRAINLGQSAGAMSGTAAFGYLAGGAAAASGLSEVSSLFDSAAALAVSAGTAGSSYVDALKNGAGFEAAAAYALLSGALEYKAERLFGGNPLLDRKPGTVNTLVKSVGGNRRLLDFLSARPIETISEGLEEAVSTVLSPVLQRLTYDPEAPPAELRQILNSVVDGMILSGFMQVGNAVLSNGKRKMQNFSAARMSDGLSDVGSMQQKSETALMWQAVGELGESGLKAMAAAADGRGDLPGYVRGFAEYYKAGKAGHDVMGVSRKFDGSLNMRQITAAYFSGQNDGRAARSSSLLSPMRGYKGFALGGIGEGSKRFASSEQNALPESKMPLEEIADMDYDELIAGRLDAGGFSADEPMAEEPTKEELLLSLAYQMIEDGTLPIGGGEDKLTEGAGDAWYKADGSLNLPPNYGAVKGTEKIIDLQPGSKLGRFGTYGKSSDFVTAPGSAAETLSLPPYTDTSIYQEFTVLKPIPGVTQSTVAPWGGSVGGGMQYRLPMTIEDLLLNGYICK